MTFKKIVVCTDFSDSSRNAFEKALELANSNKAQLDILHIREPIVNPLRTSGGGLSDEAILATLNAIEEEIKKEYAPKIDSHLDWNIIVREGHASSEIVTYLKESEADLVVTGSSGLSGRGLVIFGSISRRIAHKAPCNVLIIREKKD